MSADDEPVPRLPRTRGFKLSMQQLVRIGLTGALLVLVIAIQRPCADSVSKFVTGFGEEGSAASMPRPGAVEPPSGRGSAADYEQLRPDMTEAEIKAAIERSKARAAAERAAAERAAAARAGSGAAP